MRKKLETELKVGIFVSFGVGLIMIAILILGGSDSVFSSKNHYTAHFSRVDGLITGSKVILGGVPVGTVNSIEFDNEQRSIRVAFTVRKTSGDWIRADSTVEIATQGVLGDKYLSIDAGSDDNPILPPNSDIPNRPSKDLSQFLNKGDQLMVSLNSIASSLDRVLKTFEVDHRSEVFFKGMASTAKNLSLASTKINSELSQFQLKKALGNLSQILEKINNGTGTLGALVNDSSLYEEVRAVVGGVNRNRIFRNLIRQSIKNSGEKATKEADSKQTR